MCPPSLGTPSLLIKVTTVLTFMIMIFLFFSKGLATYVCIPKWYSLFTFLWALCKWDNTIYFCCCCSVTKSCLILCNPMDCSMPGFPILHYLTNAQTRVRWVDDAFQPPHSLLPASPPVFNLSHHQGLFQWFSSSHQVAKVLELQLWRQSFQWIFRIEFL